MTAPATSTLDPEVLRSMPKVELHTHLEGSLRVSRLIELAAAHDLALPTDDPDALYRFDDLADFLRVYEIACRALVTPHDFARATYEALEDAATTSNVRYREMFFNPSLHDAKYASMLEGVVAGAEAAEVDHGIRCRLIPSIYRQDEPAAVVEMVREIVARPDDRVVGIGMDGDEVSAPPERFVEAYRIAGRAGLHRTAHVAHDAPASFIETCLNDLGCERVDHGYHVIDDPHLVDRLRERAVPFLCATPTPPLCGWSDDLAESPIRKMIDAGLAVTLNSDDPTMLHTDLGAEFVKVCIGWQLSAERAAQLVDTAITAAWCDDTERAELRREIMPEVERMLGLDRSGGDDGARFGTKL